MMTGKGTGSGSGADDRTRNTAGAKGGPDDPRPDDPRTVPGNPGSAPTVLRPKDTDPPPAGPVPEKPTRPRKDLKRGGAPGGALGES